MARRRTEVASPRDPDTKAINEEGETLVLHEDPWLQSSIKFRHTYSLTPMSLSPKYA